MGSCVCVWVCEISGVRLVTKKGYLCVLNAACGVNWSGRGTTAQRGWEEMKLCSRWKDRELSQIYVKTRQKRRQGYLATLILLLLCRLTTKAQSLEINGEVAPSSVGNPHAAGAKTRPEEAPGPERRPQKPKSLRTGYTQLRAS